MLSPWIQMYPTGRHKDFSAKLEAGCFQTRAKNRPDARCLQLAQDLSIWTNPRLLKLEDIGEDDDIAFHAHHLGDGRYLS